MSDTHEYDGFVWRKLLRGEGILAGDRFQIPDPWGGDGAWNEVRGGSYAVGQAFNPSRFYPMYRKVRPVKTRMVTITYQVTEEYAKAQAREVEGRNDNITRRIDACKAVVGDLSQNAREKERMRDELSELERVKNNAIADWRDAYGKFQAKYGRY